MAMLVSLDGHSMMPTRLLPTGNTEEMRRKEVAQQYELIQSTD